MGRLPLKESVAGTWLTGWESAIGTEDPKVRAILTTCEHDINRRADVRFNPGNDYLARDRGTLSVGTAPSDGRGVGVGGVEEGRLVGQRREGRGAFTVVAY
jgi:hypothetical protein